ncbi:MAG: PDZ domain-containing protein, partial [Hymenobacter sp.]
GMVDETQDADALAGPPQPDEFRSKPAWQRLLVMLGGIMMNVLTGAVIFSALTYKYGTEYLPAKEARYGVATTQLGRDIGFRDGDQIIKINGRPFEEFNEVYNPDVLLNNESYYTVERQGQLLDLPKLPKTFFNRLNKQGDSALTFVRARAPFSVEEVKAGTPAAKAGLLAGDSIVRVGTLPVRYFDQLQRALTHYKGQAVPVGIVRNGQPKTLTATVNTNGTIGFAPKLGLSFGRHYYGLGTSIKEGSQQAVGTIGNLVTVFGKIFKREVAATDVIGGPAEITQQFSGHQDWLRFWLLTASLSMSLAFFNLLPIPALDGGHVLFILYEMIVRRPPPAKFLEYAQRVGVLILLAFMLYFYVLKYIIRLF